MPQTIKKKREQNIIDKKKSKEKEKNSIQNALSHLSNQPFDMSTINYFW